MRRYKSTTDFKPENPWLYPGFKDPSIGSSNKLGQLPFGLLSDEKDTRAYAGGGITTQTGDPFSDAVNNKNAN